MYKTIFLKILGRCKHGSLILKEGSAEFQFGRDDSGSRKSRAAIIVVNSPIFYRKVVLGQDNGMGEAYWEGMWDSPDMTPVFAFFILNRDCLPSFAGLKKLTWFFLSFTGLNDRFQNWLRPNTRSGSRKNIKSHYDVGNDFYRLWLDGSMTYSAALFSNPREKLERAQINKYDALCRKIDLNENDHVLEIGSGWGGFALFAARKYGCRVTSITVSEAQLKEARARLAMSGLAGKVQFLLMDYRDIKGQYDKIVSIEMVEALGYRYLDTFFRTCSRLLAPGGAMGLQAITMPDHLFHDYRRGTPDFIRRHVFPGGLLVSLQEMLNSLVRTSQLNVQHLESMAGSYALTLSRWKKNLSERFSEIRARGYQDALVRKWECYLAMCEASFAERYINVVQLVLARPGNRLSIVR
ncbi:MAG: class I SAM-dependent methyltransferase [Spirochaetales bacterium]|nr:class I SAM-dependent methyltransferase [Spirochaetales bacterium]